MHPSGPARTAPPPSVSVVIPAYNYAGYVGRAVASVLAQDHLQFEVLVVDDGSTDATAEVVAGFTDPRLRYIFQANAGLSAARNTGLREARHEFIAFLDADDQWLPTHLSAALAEFARLGPAFAMVAAPHVNIDATGGELPARPDTLQPAREIPVADIILKTRFQPSAVVLRRAVFAACGDFDSSLRSSEDREMWIRIGARNRIFLQGRPTVLIRKHAANMSKQADRMRASRRIVIRRAQAAGVVPRTDLAFWAQAWALYFFQNAWALHQEGRRAEALRQALAALCVWPWAMPAAALNVPRFFRLRALARFAGLLPRER